MTADVTQKYALQWNHQVSTICGMFDQFQATNAYSDVKLVCNGGVFIKCHRMVLAACSPFFQGLFDENNCSSCNHPTFPISTIVMLPDVGESEMRALLNFMYKGVVEVTGDELAKVLKAAEVLKIKGIVPEIPDDGVKAEMVKTKSSFSQDLQKNCQASGVEEERNCSASETTDSCPNFSISPDSGYTSTSSPPASDKENMMPEKNTFSFALSKGLPTTTATTTCTKNPQNIGTCSTSKCLDLDMDTNIKYRQIQPKPRSGIQASAPTSTKNPASESGSPIVVLPQHFLDRTVGKVGVGIGNSVASAPFRSGSISISSDDLSSDNAKQGWATDKMSEVSEGKNKYPCKWFYVEGGDKKENQVHKIYKKYTNRDVLCALDAVRAGMSPLEASRQFSIPSRTLYDKVKKLGFTRKRGINPSPLMDISKEPVNIAPAEKLRKENGDGHELDENKMDSNVNEQNGVGELFRIPVLDYRTIWQFGCLRP